MRTLYSRLILSHLLPLLVTVPLASFVLIYVVESQVVLPTTVRDLRRQAVLIAGIAGTDDQIWSGTAPAHAFVTQVAPDITAEHLMVLDAGGHLLASSDPDDERRIGQQLELPGWKVVDGGAIDEQVTYSRQFVASRVDILVPVRSADGQIRGALQLTQPFTGVADQFMLISTLITGIMIMGLLISSSIGWTLALHLGRSLRQVTWAIDRYATRHRLICLPDDGPEEIHRLILAFNTLMQRLHTSETQRSRLMANIVHELGRPLGTLYSAIQALAAGAGDDPALRRELLTGMEQEMRGLQRLLDDMTHAAETPALYRKPVELRPWLAVLLNLRRAEAEQNGLRWEVTLPPALPTLQIDPERMAQALGNLLNNAIKYTPRGGVIAIDAGATPAAVWIQIADTGCGIAPEDQAHIFDPFYHGHSSVSTRHGMGLGLHIMRGLVVAHGGRVELQSRPGAGSCFTIWLPLDSEQPLDSP